MKPCHCRLLLVFHERRAFKKDMNQSYVIQIGIVLHGWKCLFKDTVCWHSSHATPYGLLALGDVVQSIIWQKSVNSGSLYSLILPLIAVSPQRDGTSFMILSSLHSEDIPKFMPSHFLNGADENLVVKMVDEQSGRQWTHISGRFTLFMNCVT